MPVTEPLRPLSATTQSGSSPASLQELVAFGGLRSEPGVSGDFTPANGSVTRGHWSRDIGRAIPPLKEIWPSALSCVPLSGSPRNPQPVGILQVPEAQGIAILGGQSTCASLSVQGGNRKAERQARITRQDHPISQTVSPEQELIPRQIPGPVPPCPA